MVVLAQLVRASVVVPRVVGSSPIFHPSEEKQSLKAVFLVYKGFFNRQIEMIETDFWFEPCMDTLSVREYWIIDIFLLKHC